MATIPFDPNTYPVLRRGSGGPDAPASIGAVSSVFGRIGAVVAVAGDYNSDQITNISGVPGADVSDALDSLNTELDAVTLELRQPFKATYYVDPAFIGVSTGSMSNPFTTIAAAFAFAASVTISSFVVKIPPGITIAENVVYPATGGHVEISSDQVLAGSVGSRITGNITLDITSGALRAKLTNIVLVGNITGNAGNGTAGFLRLTAVRQTGTITLTLSGSGTWSSAFRGLGCADSNKAGGSTTGLVNIAGLIDGDGWVFEGGITEAGPAVSPYPGSQFQACWFGSTSGSPIPIGLNGLSLNAAFYDCIFVGPTTFTAGVSNYVIYMDGASLASLNNSIAGIILSGTGIQLKTINANASSRTTIANNVASTPLGARNADGLYEIIFDTTLLVAGTAGALQLNVIYTDMTSTLVTVAVGGALNIAGAVGTKAQGSLAFRHNGAAAPIAYSFTGVVTPGAMSVAASVALMCRT